MGNSRAHILDNNAGANPGIFLYVPVWGGFKPFQTIAFLSDPNVTIQATLILGMNTLILYKKWKH